MTQPTVIEIEVNTDRVEIESPPQEHLVEFVAVPVPGPPGLAGIGGLTYNQPSPAATWTITHSLGKRPASVSVWIDDELVDTNIEVPDISTVVITFANPQTGRAEIF